MPGAKPRCMVEWRQDGRRFREQVRPRALTTSSEEPEATERLQVGGATSTRLLKAATAREQGARDEQSYQSTRALRRPPFADLSAPLTGDGVDGAQVRCRPCDSTYPHVRQAGARTRDHLGPWRGKMSCRFATGDSRQVRQTRRRTRVRTGASPRRQGDH